MVSINLIETGVVLFMNVQSYQIAPCSKTCSTCSKYRQRKGFKNFRSNMHLSLSHPATKTRIFLPLALAVYLHSQLDRKIANNWKITLQKRSVGTYLSMSNQNESVVNGKEIQKTTTLGMKLKIWVLGLIQRKVLKNTAIYFAPMLHSQLQSRLVEG